LDYIDKTNDNNIDINKEYVIMLFNSLNIGEITSKDNKNESNDLSNRKNYNDLLKILNQNILNTNFNNNSKFKLDNIFREYFYYNIQSMNLDNHMKKILNDQEENISSFFKRLHYLCNSGIDPFVYLSICNFIKSILNMNKITSNHINNKNKNLKNNQNEFILNFIKSNPETFLYLLDNIIEKSSKVRFNEKNKTTDLNKIKDEFNSIFKNKDINEIFMDYNLNSARISDLKRLCLNSIHELYNKSKTDSNQNKYDNSLILDNSKSSFYLISDIVKILSFNPYLFNDIFFENNLSENTLSFNLLKKNSNLNQYYYCNSLLEKINNKESLDKLRENLPINNNETQSHHNESKKNTIFLE